MDQTVFGFHTQAELCQADISGECTGTRDVRMTCRIEGADISMCHNCAGAWNRIAHDGNMQDRCPRCYQHATGIINKPDIEVVPTEPLTGPVARAVDIAMHAEGLLSDVRRKVLIRLAFNSPWLAEIPGLIQPAPDVTLSPEGIYEFRQKWDTARGMP